MKPRPVEEMNSSRSCMTCLGNDSSHWPAFRQEKVATYEDILDNGTHLCNYQNFHGKCLISNLREIGKNFLITILSFSIFLHQDCLFLLFLLLGGGHSFISTVDSRTSVTSVGCCFSLIFQSGVAKTSSLCFNKNWMA